MNKMFHETDADNTHHLAIKISVERPEIDCVFTRSGQFLVERKTSVLFDNDDRSSANNFLVSFVYLVSRLFAEKLVEVTSRNNQILRSNPDPC